MRGKKLERAFFLDLPPDEAFARYVQTKPEEVEKPAKRLKSAEVSPDAPKPTD